jgi:hypothetical protein
VSKGTFKQYEYENGRNVDYVFFDCPGCGYHHSVAVNGTHNESSASWGWNGDLENPTFTPSVLVNASMPEHRCHSFVREGKIEFLSDCFHSLAGQTVELPECTW